MFRALFWVLCFVFFSPSVLIAETVEVAPGLLLDFALSQGGWVVSREAPEFLVKQRAEGLEHELAHQGKETDFGQLLRLAQKRLKNNELYIYNPVSQAHLEMDFSPLRDNESVPSRNAISKSARFAGESLASEPGVSDVTFSNRWVNIEGAMAAHKIEASFQLHGKPRKFLGIIGFFAPYWFFFYYTDPLATESHYTEMEQILKSLVLRPKGGK